jgi:hypothetical protein
MSTDLGRTFVEVSKLFNQAKYDQLGRYFDIDVIMKRVDDPGSIVGIGNLMAYLNAHQKVLKPQFENVKIVSETGNKGTHGIITGTANYRDKKRDKNTIPVQFTFVFTRPDTKSDWLLAVTFATPTM